MAKAFYDIQKTAGKLGITTEEVKQLVEEGKLDQFQDQDKIMFDSNQVEELVSMRETLRLDDLDDTGEMLTLEDTGEGLAIETDEADIADIADETGIGEIAEDGTAAGDTALGDDTQTFDISLDDEDEGADTKGETDAFGVESLDETEESTGDFELLDDDPSGESTGMAASLGDADESDTPDTEALDVEDSVAELDLGETPAAGTEGMDIEQTDAVATAGETDTELEALDVDADESALELDLSEDSALDLDDISSGTEELELDDALSDLDATDAKDSLELDGTAGGTEELDIGDELSDLAATDDNDILELDDSAEGELELGDADDGTESITLGDTAEADAITVGEGGTAELDVDELEFDDSDLGSAGLSSFDTGIADADTADSGAGETGVTGVSVFDTHEIDAVDSMARTQVDAGSVDEDELSLESVGSGSGLLDLTREADDTSLGAAELLDDIAPSGESHAGGTLEATGAGTAATGIFDAGGADAGSGISPLEEGLEEEAEGGIAIATTAHSAADRAEVFGGLTMMITFVGLMLAVIVTFTAGGLGQIAGLTEWIISQQNNVWIAIGGVAGLGVVMFGVDLFLNKK